MALPPNRDWKVINSLIDQWIRKELEKQSFVGMNLERRYGWAHSALCGILWRKYSCGEELTSADSDHLSRIIREIQITDPSFSELDLENWSYGPDTENDDIAPWTR